MGFGDYLRGNKGRSEAGKKSAGTPDDDRILLAQNGGQKDDNIATDAVPPPASGRKMTPAETAIRAQLNDEERAMWDGIKERRLAGEMGPRNEVETELSHRVGDMLIAYDRKHTAPAPEKPAPPVVTRISDPEKAVRAQLTEKEEKIWDDIKERRAAGEKAPSNDEEHKVMGKVIAILSAHSKEPMGAENAPQANPLVPAHVLSEQMVEKKHAEAQAYRETHSVEEVARNRIAQTAVREHYQEHADKAGFHTVRVGPQDDISQDGFAYPKEARESMEAWLQVNRVPKEKADKINEFMQQRLDDPVRPDKADMRETLHLAQSNYEQRRERNGDPMQPMAKKEAREFLDNLVNNIDAPKAMQEKDYVLTKHRLGALDHEQITKDMGRVFESLRDAQHKLGSGDIPKEFQMPSTLPGDREKMAGALSEYAGHEVARESLRPEKQPVSEKGKLKAEVRQALINYQENNRVSSEVVDEFGDKLNEMIDSIGKPTREQQMRMVVGTHHPKVQAAYKEQMKDTLTGLMEDGAPTDAQKAEAKAEVEKVMKKFETPEKDGKDGLIKVQKALEKIDEPLADYMQSLVRKIHNRVEEAAEKIEDRIPTPAPKGKGRE